jgi:hypothetical protein
MKKIVAIMVSLIFVLGVASLGLSAEKADKCATCHKDEKALDKIAALFPPGVPTPS